MSLLLLSISFFICGLATSFKAETPISSVIEEKYLLQLEYLNQQAKQLSQILELVILKKAAVPEAREQFYRVKKGYKQVEYLVEYLDQDLAKSLNGAPIPKVVVEEADYQTLSFLPASFRTFPPEGIQVIEELLFSEEVNKEMEQEALVLAYSLQEKVLLFTNSLKKQPLTDKQILESLREEMIRVMAMGITGFDAPAAGKELEFVSASFQPLLATAQLYEHTTNAAANQHATKATHLLEEATTYLKQHSNFETFDRLFFIREFADPAYGSLTALQEELAPQSVSRSGPVNQAARSIFSRDFLKAGYYAKQDRKVQKPELLELGRTLFFDPVLSANNQRSCASCHNPSKAFTDGKTRSLAFDFKGTLQRNSPTLLNAVFGTAYFYDSRSHYLQDQVEDVVLKTDEMHGSYEAVVETLQQSREYKKMFRRAFYERQDQTINTNTINRAIAAYVQSLVALDSPFDRYMRHETEMLGASAKRGFNLFMGKAACGTCHFAPIFNGTVPPKFMESETEVLGVTASADFSHPMLDEDLGKAGFIPADAWKHSFKTPTVRNIGLTAPYMHNGVFSSLAEVMEFYDLGGGAGLGLEVPNQTLPSQKLNLSEQEKADIISFLHVLSDTSTVFTAPDHLPGFSAGRADLNKRVVGGIY